MTRISLKKKLDSYFYLTFNDENTQNSITLKATLDKGFKVQQNGAFLFV